MPLPPAQVSTTAPKRTIVGSLSKYSAIPAHTPSIILSLFDLYFGKDNFTKEESAIDKFIIIELSKIEKLVDVTSGKRKQDLLEYLCLLQNAKERRTKYE